MQPPGRPYALSAADANVAHRDPWDDAAVARFKARTRHVRSLGLRAADADDLAARLHLRDVHADYRHLCVECASYRPGRCGNHRGAGLLTAEVGRELATLFQHCGGFAGVELAD